MNIDERLERIEHLLAMTAKKVLSVKEVAAMLGRSESRIRHLVAQRKIPHYKNDLGHISFLRAEIDEWRLGMKILTVQDIESKAVTYTKLNKLKKKDATK